MTSFATHRRWRAGIGLAVGMVLLGACVDDSGQAAERSGAGSAGTSEEAEAAATAWALDFTGGTAGPATGEPYRIGFGHSGDFFPEGDAAADAAVEFVNRELGGVNGRPLEIVRCNIAVAEDGASCGATLANDDTIDLVIGGLILGGNADFYASLDGNAAAIIALPLDASDYTSEHAVAYNMGALGSGLSGAAFLAEDLRPSTAALVVTDDVAGRAANDAFRPIVEAAGIDLRQVFVPPTATAPEIAGALQAAGAASADVVVIGLFEPGCIATYDAMRSLGIDPEVVTTAVCWGNAMQAHLAEAGEEDPVPNGWHFGWFGYGLFGDDVEPGIAAYRTKMAEYGAGDVAASIAAAPTWDAVLTATRIINGVGADGASYETLDQAVRGFTGPSIVQSGPIECGIPPFISICASEASIVRYSDGEWSAVRTRTGGNPIELSAFTRPGR